MPDIHTPTSSFWTEFPIKPFGLCTALLLLVVIIDMIFVAQGQSFKREGGGLETMSAAFYMVAAVVFFSVTPNPHWQRLWHIPTLMILFAMRELDFDKAFTTSGVLSSNLYRGDSPVMTKVIAGSVVILLLVVLYRTVRHGWPATLQGLRARAPWAFLVLVAAVSLVFSKAIDGLARKMLAFDVVVPVEIDALAAVIEEVSEAFIPIFVILAILSRWKRSLI